MQRLILASGSPRRRELLAQITDEFQVVPSSFDETAGGLSACETVLLFAREKAREVHARAGGCAVLGSDTVVAVEGRILGKPRDEGDAAGMLRLLSGRTHSVFTGVCLVTDESEDEFFTETRVTFFPLSEELIAEYVASGKPLDKAGAYGIQDGFPLVKSFEGSYTGVIGLPVEETRSLLKRRNVI